MAKEGYVIVNFKVTPQEYKLIERHAKKEEMNVSDYVRTTLYLDWVAAGDREAIKLVLKKMGEKLGKKLRAMGWMRAEEQGAS